MTNHDDEAVDKVCTLKKREECFSYSKVSHCCHFEIRIEKIRIHITWKKNKKKTIWRPFFSCQINRSKVQVDHYLYHFISVSRKHPELVKSWSICLTMRKNIFFAFLVLWYCTSRLGRYQIEIDSLAWRIIINFWTYYGTIDCDGGEICL